MTGPDLPDPNELFDIGVWRDRWPSGTYKAELFAGVLVFSGEFDHRDVETAQRTYPGRRVLLNEGGGIEIHPGGDTPLQSFPERMAQLRESNPPG